MPNHVINEVIFDGLTPAQMREVQNALLDGKGRVDFSILLPVPLNVWQGDVGREHQETFKAGNCLDWAAVNWGTKWNAHGQGGRVSNWYGPAGMILRFRTAWNAPHGWLLAIFNRFKLPFDYNYLSEGGWPAKTGMFRQSPNESLSFVEWRETEIPDKSLLHKHLHKLLWGVEEFEEEEAEEAEESVEQ